jgi:hypothetical protein
MSSKHRIEFNLLDKPQTGQNQQTSNNLNWRNEQ